MVKTQHSHTWHFEKMKETANYVVFKAKLDENPDFNKLYVPSDSPVAKAEKVKVTVESQ